jgi:molecular chaperone HtpG
MSAQMEEMMRRMGQPVPKQTRILELNPGHPLVERLQALHGAGGDAAKIGGYLTVLRDQALLAEGGRLADGAGFAKRVQELLAAALPPTAATAAKG